MKLVWKFQNFCLLYCILPRYNHGQADRVAHKFVWLLSANHRCVLWPVGQWESSMFVALYLWDVLLVHGYNIKRCMCFFGTPCIVNMCESLNETFCKMSEWIIRRSISVWSRRPCFVGICIYSFHHSALCSN